jgi:lantibiotic modifying enzyme
MDDRSAEALRITNQALQNVNNRLHERIEALKIQALRAEIRIGRLLSLLEDTNQLHDAVELG